MTKKVEKLSRREIQDRFEAALRGAFKTLPFTNTVIKKKQKGKPAKASLSSDVSRATSKTERP
jgi:hypothetical protein